MQKRSPVWPSPYSIFISSRVTHSIRIPRCSSSCSNPGTWSLPLHRRGSTWSLQPIRARWPSIVAKPFSYRAATDNDRTASVRRLGCHRPAQSTWSFLAMYSLGNYPDLTILRAWRYAILDIRENLAVFARPERRRLMIEQEVDWSKCEDVESVPSRLSGAWVIKGTRVPAQAVVDNAKAGCTAEEIATEIFELPLERVRGVLRFAKIGTPSKG